MATSRSEKHEGGYGKRNDISEEPPARLDERASLMQVTAAFGLAMASEVIRTLAG